MFGRSMDYLRGLVNQMGLYYLGVYMYHNRLGFAIRKEERFTYMRRGVCLDCQKCCQPWGKH